MKRILLLSVLLLACWGEAAGQFTYKWTPVPMDSTWDTMKDVRATQVIGKYSPQVAPLQEIVGYSEDEYRSGRPESGLSNFAADVIRAIAEAGPDRVVYVSCNVATQARDAALFREAGYTVRKVQPVDMFCWTSGIESVALLVREQPGPQS